ncbi:hypothetical protein M8Q70_003544 [Salmonella enterica]|nr:hypothetical protein [Salmonella enterica]EDU6784851.1 hypothetical protein [Salmonella enterica subsp. enterica serovar Gaminara]EGT2787164.1 hypothetical protein [Salmonella enterica subsp. enterica serovar Carmel]EAR9571305.1 hypothetical protein [Salmonella enterica]EAT6445011.1 hypothetical protein [Salmonella enterica]
MKYAGYVTAVILSVTPIYVSSLVFVAKPTTVLPKATSSENYTLNMLRVEMDVKYHWLTGLVSMGVRGEINDEQQKWLQECRICAQNTPCLITLYKKRLQVLDDIYSLIEKPVPLTGKSGSSY